MEKKNEASCSFEQPDRYISHQQSEWLYVSLSDLNKRMETIVALLEEDGKSVIKSQRCFKRRPELIQILEELDRSYLSFGDKLHQLKSRFCQVPDADAKSSSFPGVNKNKRLMTMSDDCMLEEFGSYPFCIAGNPDADSEYLNKLAEELILTEQCRMEANTELEIMENLRGKEIVEFCSVEDMKMNMDDFSSNDASFSKSDKKSWFNLELQLTELIQGNLQHLNELAKRNIEKKAVIKKLQLDVAHLKEENMALQSCISCLKVGDKYSQFRTAKLRTLFSDKIFQGCS